MRLFMWIGALLRRFVAWLFEETEPRKVRRAKAAKSGGGEDMEAMEAAAMGDEAYSPELAQMQDLTGLQCHGPVTPAQVRAALKEWKDAENYFDHVRDPDLVEYAAYCIQTAKRRYLCLLKRTDIEERGAL